MEEQPEPDTPKKEPIVSDWGPVLFFGGLIAFVWIIYPLLNGMFRLIAMSLGILWLFGGGRPG